MSSYYRLLGVSRFASVDDIRHAYWALSRRLRGARRRDAERDARLAEIRHAYEVLSDARSRRGYDRGRFGGAEEMVAPPVHRSGHAGRMQGAATGRIGPDGDPRPVMSDESLGFPSMPRLVSRMIAAFERPVGACHPPTHQTRIRLTVREALEGARVPLSIRVRPDCPVCGGRGEIWPAPCGVCHGTGAGSLAHDVTFAIPPGVRDGARLTFSVVPPFAPEARVELRIAVQ